MNEKETTPQSEKSGLDENRKNALLRYIAIMFVVAFVFVLLSMLGELRSSEATISELNQSSTSALQKAEQLQDNNRQLETDNAYLTGRIEELEKQMEELEQDLSHSQDRAEALEDTLAGWEPRLAEAEESLEQTSKAYELLLQAQLLAANEEDPSAVLTELEAYKPYLGENAMKTYENLINKGEE